MPTRIWTVLLLALAGAATAAWLAALLRARGVRPVRALAAFFGRQPKSGRGTDPLATRQGCEDYAYFDKYMVTMGSWAWLACLFADE